MSWNTKWTWQRTETGARVLTMLGSPKPPKEVRRKVDEDAASNDLTL